MARKRKGPAAEAGPETFSGEITVASRIVDSLSSGLYESPAACLKELVNNSYDADATRVQMYVKPDADRIIIDDDGEGMSRSEFERHFAKIAESHKRENGDTTQGGRPKIGRIGIGFIAANEICDVMEITSTKAGSRELLQVEINFRNMRMDPEVRRREGDEFAKGDYVGTVRRTDTASHFTRVFLKEVRGPARDILAGATRAGVEGDAPSLYGLTADQIQAALSRADLRSWDDLNLYSQTMLGVALNVPVSYLEGWVPRRHRGAVNEFSEEVADLGFRVEYDGSPLHKPVVLGANRGRTLVHTFAYAGADVAFRGYFFAQHGALHPQDLNGVLIRIRHAAVGGYDPGFLGYPSSEGTLFQRWISGEVWADDRLEHAMNIDRRTLRVTEPPYVELQEALHAELAEVLRRVRAQLYETGSAQRRIVQAEKEVERVAAVTARSDLPLPRRQAASIAQRWKEALDSPADQRSVLRKYSVAELYGIVLEVASQELSAPEFRRFVRALTARLLGH